MKRFTRLLSAFIFAAAAAFGQTNVTSSVVKYSGSTTAQSLGDRFSRSVSILDFGGDPTGVSSNTAALNAAMTYLHTTGNSGAVLFIPEGTYLFSTKPNAVDGGITLQGDGIGRTILKRNYSESGGAHVGFIDMTCASGRNNAGGGVRDLTIYANTGTTGGAAINAESTSSVGQGQLYFSNVNITGVGTWNYPMYFDGTAKTAAPIGLRIVSIVGCSLFQADTEGLYAKGVVHFNVVNTGIFATGGAASAGFTLDGTTGVPSSNVQAFFEFCTSMNLAATSSNSVTQVMLSSTNATSLTVTSNLSEAVYFGRYGSLSGTCDGLTLIGPTSNVLVNELNVRSVSGNHFVMQPTEAYSSSQNGSVAFQPIYNSSGTRLLVSQIKQSRTSTADGQYASQIELITRAAAGSLTTGLTVKSSSVVNLSTTPSYANNAAALLGGLVAGDIYRNGDVMQIVH